MKAADFLKSLFGKKGTMDQKAYDALESDQKEMIKGVMELPDTTVKEIMVPRTGAVFISVDASREDLLNTLTATGHSRFPVYEETIDNVIGILYVKDVLHSLVRDGELDVRKILRKPFFIPISKHINELLRELRRRRVHIAVVVDEYGGVSGIICMEDIIEEIIGDIQDEFDNEEEDILSLGDTGNGDGAWLCDARVNLEDLSEAIGVELPTADFDTLGGFVFDLFGKIPVKYEKAVYNNMDFIVQNMEGRKINTVKIILHRDGGA